MTQEGQALGEDATEEAGLELGPEKDKLGKERPEHSGRDWGSKSWRGMKCKSGSNEYTNLELTFTWVNKIVHPRQLGDVNSPFLGPGTRVSLVQEVQLRFSHP